MPPQGQQGQGSGVVYDVLYPQAAALGTPASKHPLEKQITVSIADTALAMLYEDAATPNHIQRANWARNTLQNVQFALSMFMWAVIRDPNIQAKADLKTVPDAEIQTIVTRLVDKLAV